MALTKGNRQNITTVTSVQSRMGVVPTYAGSGIAAAAEVMGDTITGLANKQATIEEEKYKAQFEIDTTTYLTELARLHPLEPDTFTNKAESYINTLVEKAPPRFKSYTEKYSKLMAAREGDAIYNRWYNKNQQDSIKLFLDGMEVFQDKELATIDGLNNEEFDKYWIEQLLPNLEDKMISYNNLYESLDPEYSGSLSLPDVFMQDVKLTFEKARMFKKTKNILAIANAQDAAEFGAGQVPYGTGKSNLEKAQSYIINQLIPAYNKKADADDGIDGFSVLTNSTEEERTEITDALATYVTNNVKQYETLQKGIDEVQKLNIKTNFNLMMDEIKSFQNDYAFKNPAELIGMGFDATQIKEINDALTLNRAIVAVSANLDDGFNIDIHTNNIMNYINNQSGGDTDYEYADVKKAVVDYHILKTVYAESYAQNGFFTNEETMANIDLSYDIRNNQPSEQLNRVIEFASTYGIMPDILQNFIDSASGLNYKDEVDRRLIAEIAGTVYTLSQRSGFNMIDVNGHNIMPLLDLHEKISNLPKDARVSQETAYEYYFSLMQKTPNNVSEINDRINEVLLGADGEDDDILIKELFSEEVMKRQDRYNIFGIKLGALIGGVGLNDDELQQELQSLVSKHYDTLLLYLNSRYQEPYQVTRSNIKEHLDTAIKLFLNDMRNNNGYAFE